MKGRCERVASLTKKLHRRVIGRSAGGLVAALFISMQAYADTQTGNITVSAQVVASCTLTGATINFGPISNLGAGGVTASATGGNGLQVKCTNGTHYSISLGAGEGPGASTTNRVMKNGSVTLNYNLYTDANYSNVWGAAPSTIVAGAGYIGIGSGDTQQIPVYGKIPGGQALTVGNYSDTVVATLNF